MAPSNKRICFRILRIALGFVLLSSMLPAFTAASAEERFAESPVRSEIDQRTRQENEFRYFLTHLVSFYLESGNYSKLLTALNSLDETQYGLETKKMILFYKAECNKALNNHAAAYEQYWRVRMLISSKNDPLYEDVLKNLSITGKRKKSLLRKIKIRIKAINTDPAFLLKQGTLFFILLLCFALLTWAFHRLTQKFDFRAGSSLWFWVKSLLSGSKAYLSHTETKETSRDSSDKGEPVIIKEDDLIKEKEMIAQDGRILSFTGTDSEKTSRTSEMTDYLHLIKKGHKMILSLNRCVPYPLVLIWKTPLLGRMHPFWSHTFFGLILVGIWTACNWLVSVLWLDQGSLDLVSRFLVAATLIAVFEGIRIMSFRTVEAVDELVTLIENEEHLENLETWIGSLLRSPWQLYFAAVLYLIYIFECFARSNISLIDMIFIALLMLLTSPLIWFLFRGMMVTRYIAGMTGLQVNPLSPLKTLGLQKWISVIGTYALVGSIVLTFGGCIPIISAFIKGEAYSIWTLIWLMLFMPLIIFTWIYPYFKMRALVKHSKNLRMHYFKTMISKSFKDWLSIEKQILDLHIKPGHYKSEGERLEHLLGQRAEIFNKAKPQIDHMKTYHDIFKEIDKSPESFFDIYAALKLLQIMGLPTLFALFSYIYNLA